ncbi:TRAP dicarboxylate transporter, DctP subunit, partial [Candidatus Magnetobacterium bavaricum]
MKDEVVKAIGKRYIIVAGIVLCIAMAVLFYTHPFGKSATGRKDAKVYELDLGHNMPPGSAMYIAAQKFADTVKDRTRGRVKINISPAQKLGDD